MLKSTLFLVIMLVQVSFHSLPNQPIQPQTYQQNGILSQPGEIILDGYIGEHYDIIVLLSKTGENKLEGRYLYKRIKKYIHLEGIVEGDSLILTEWNEKGEKTGRFRGDLREYPTISGTWERPNGSGKLTFYLKQILPVGVLPSTGIFEFAPDSLSVRGKKRAPGKILEGQTKNYDEILYNLNGILTRVFHEEDSDGWSSANYVCNNLVTGKRLEFGDVFNEESKDTVHAMIVSKVRENCPEQLEADYPGDDIDFNNNYVIINRGGISFISPCQRSWGYFKGSYLVDFSFEEMKPFLKNKY